MTEKKKAEKAVAKKSQKKEEKIVKIENAYDIIKFVLMTEKAVQNIEFSNKLTFIIHRDTTKDDVKKAVESAFEKKVDYVNTVMDQKNRKKAFVKFSEEGAAGEIAIRLGII